MMQRRVIDADGHVVERDDQLFKYLDAPFGGREDLLTVPFFPSLDGWHRAARRVADDKGRAMSSPQAREWLAFINEAGNVYELFGSGGGDELARDLGVPLLSRVPIDRAVVDGGDEGEPVVLRSDSPAAAALNEIIDTILSEAIPPVEMANCSARLLEAVEAALDASDTRI